MVKHVVMWKIKATEGNTKEQNIQKVKEILEAMPPKISEIHSLQVGINFNSKPIAYDLVLITEHKDKEALGNYQVHAEHQKVADFITKVKESGVVVDFEF